MLNPATPQDVADRWRSLSPAEQTVVATRLDDAWALLQSLRPLLPSQLEARTVSATNVVRLLCDAVLRVQRNPDGYSTERLGDYSYTRDSSVAEGRLHFTAAELSDITPGYVSTKSVRLDGSW